MTDSVRLAKRVVEVLACSRREAEQYIEGGWVSVDGVVVEAPGQRVTAAQNIALLPEASLKDIDPVTVLVHKPAGMSLEEAHASISEQTLYEMDRSGIRFLKAHTRKMDSSDAFEAHVSGLVVFTQDWHIARKVIEERNTLEHEYIVETSGDIEPGGLTKLNGSMKMEGRFLPSMKVSWQNETRLRIAVKGPQPGQIVSVCEQVGLKVVDMRLIRLGRVSMSGLPVGQWRYLKGYERF